MWSDKGTIKKFIDNSKPHLNQSGRILILISTLSKPEKIIEQFKSNGFEVSIIKTLKIPWEELKVLEAKVL
jgi:precorrin-6B methylase 2